MKIKGLFPLRELISGLGGKLTRPWQAAFENLELELEKSDEEEPVNGIGLAALQRLEDLEKFVHGLSTTVLLHRIEELERRIEQQPNYLNKIEDLEMQVALPEIPSFLNLYVATSGGSPMEYLTLHEQIADPADPPEGYAVLWMGDGTGTGGDGDILMKVTAGGSTKTFTLIDFSI